MINAHKRDRALHTQKVIEKTKNGHRIVSPQFKLNKAWNAAHKHAEIIAVSTRFSLVNLLMTEMIGHMSNVSITGAAMTS